MKTFNLSADHLGHGPEIVGTKYRAKTLKKLFRTLGMKDHEQEFFTADLVPEPDNPYNHEGKAISVRWNDEVIGYIADDDVEDYQQIRRLVASGIRPQCKARIWTHTYDDERRYWIRLANSNIDRVIPLNDPPADNWALLPPRRSVKVTKTDENFDHLQDFLPPSGYGTLLVTLHPVEAGVSKKYTGIEVRLEGERIGELSRVTSSKVSPIVELWQENGWITVAKAEIRGSSLAIDISLRFTPASEMSEADLDPEPCPLPKLVPYEEDPDNYDVPDAWQGNRSHFKAKMAQRAELETVVSGIQQAGMLADADKVEAASPDKEVSYGNFNSPPLEAPENAPQILNPSVIKVIKYIVAAVVSVCGIPFFLYGVFATDLASLMFSVPFLLPPAWFIYNEWRDRSGAPAKRYWWVITGICLASLAIFVSILPPAQ